MQETANLSIADVLSIDKVIVRVSVSSRKRLFALLADTLCQDEERLQSDTVFKSLTERERLGSTALGNGIAIPHGRVGKIDQPIVAVIRLSTPIDYDSPDRLPVWLAASLLVPDEDCSSHLGMLSELAGFFNDASFIGSLKACQDNNEMHALLISKRLN